MEVQVTKEGDQEYLIIKAPIERPLYMSSTGASIIVATSGGNVATTAQLDGKPITVGMTAYIRVPKKPKAVVADLSAI
jgi:hypothetical protein